MPYTVEMVEDVGYVTVVLTGNVNKSEHEASTEEASAALTANDCRKLLVEATRANHRMPVTENYDFASALRERHPLGIRISVLVLDEDLDHVKFVETVARNRGVDLTVFSDREQALNWLLDG